MSRPNADWGLAWRIARRELRGGLGGFRIFLACLAIGVAAITAVGALSASVTEGLRRDGRALLGGDVSLRLIHRQINDAQRDWLADQSQAISHVATLRATAINADDPARRRLVELKAVDQAYPLFGRAELAPGGDLTQALARRDGVWGAVAEAGLFERLGMAPGDRLRIGATTFELRAVLTREPDKAVGFFSFGPRLMIARDALADTGLMVPGSLINYYYRLALRPGDTPDAFRARAAARQPDAGWRIRDLGNANPGLQHFIDRLTQFLTLVGLTSLLVGGIGVANAARSHIDTKTLTIATLKSLGAPQKLTFRIYLLQVMALAVLGIVLGLAAGSIAPLAALPLLADQLPITVAVTPHPQTLLIGATFGVLTAFVFALWPLARSRDIPAAQIFRAALPGRRGRLRPTDLAAFVIGTAILVALTYGTATDKRIALWFLAGATVSLIGFALAGDLIAGTARRLQSLGRPRLRLALANLHRPGAATRSVTLSLGLGLTVLVVIAQIQGNLDRRIRESLPEQAPSFFFLDIRPDQRAAFIDGLGALATVSDIRQVPMLRGRVSAVNGTPADAIEVGHEVAWFLRGDRGLTFAADPPDNAEIIQGRWWPADYAGPPAISLSEDIALGLGLRPGDTLSVNILGRDITATITNIRRVDWGSLDMNFSIVFAPGTLERAPHSYLAVARAAPEMEESVDRTVSLQFPNVSAIRVREALDAANRLLAGIGQALRATATVTLLAGMLVLAGAVAAGHRRRVYESVVLKTLGARRRDVLRIYLLEYGLLGAATGIIAAGIGSAAAWAIMTQVIGDSFTFLPRAAALPVIGGLAATTAIGFLGTWRALGRKAAPLLRNQ